jgi:hypothetical protein
MRLNSLPSSAILLMYDILHACTWTARGNKAWHACLHVCQGILLPAGIALFTACALDTYEGDASCKRAPFLVAVVL